MYQVMQKLKYVKLHVKGWSKGFVGHTQHKLVQNESKLKHVEGKLLNQPDSPRLNDLLHRLLRQREKLLLFNRKYWGKLKRKDWLVNGDCNPKFFHQRPRTRRKQQTIIKLKTDDGIWVDDPQDTASQFIADYQARFTTAGRGPLNSMDVDI